VRPFWVSAPGAWHAPVTLHTPTNALFLMVFLADPPALPGKAPSQ
jgi:hypothetical protein